MRALLLLLATGMSGCKLSINIPKRPRPDPPPVPHVNPYVRPSPVRIEK